MSRTLRLAVRNSEDGKLETRNFAVGRIEDIAEESPWPGCVKVTLSYEQANEIIRTLWRLLPPEERPCP